MERAFSDDLADLGEMLSPLEPIAQRVVSRLAEIRRKNQILSLKLDHDDHRGAMGEIMLRRIIQTEDALKRLVERLLQRSRPLRALELVRLLGPSASLLTAGEATGV